MLGTFLGTWLALRTPLQTLVKSGLGLWTLGMSIGHAQGHILPHSQEIVTAIGQEAPGEGGLDSLTHLALRRPSLVPLWPGLLSWVPCWPENTHPLQ